MKAPLLGLAKDVLLLGFGAGKTPFRVTFMVSEECPLRCATCGIWKTAAPRTPSLSDMERFFRANPSLSWLNFTGGEIFMRRDAADLFGLAAATLPRLGLLNFPTAGQHPDRIAAAVEAGLAAGLFRLAVTVSFDGGPGSHDRMRGKKGAFDAARETFLLLRKKAASSKGRLSVFPGTTLSEGLFALSPDPLGDLVDALGLEGSHEIHLNLAHRSGHYYRNEGLGGGDGKKTETLLRAALDARRRAATPWGGRLVDAMERAYLGCAPLYLATGRPPLPCAALDGTVFIDAGLDVYPCTVFSRRAGNLREAGYSLEKLASGEEWKKARLSISSGACPGCWSPCEAYPAILKNLFRPGLFRILKAAALPGGRRP